MQQLDLSKTYCIQHGAKYCLLRITSINQDSLNLVDEKTGKHFKSTLAKFMSGLNTGEIRVTAESKDGWEHDKNAGSWVYDPENILEKDDSASVPTVVEKDGGYDYYCQGDDHPTGSVEAVEFMNEETGDAGDMGEAMDMALEAAKEAAMENGYEVPEEDEVEAAVDIKTLLTKPYVGNHHQDSSLMKALDGVIMDENAAMDDRVKALKRIDEIMGEPLPSYNKYEVEKYVKEYGEANESLAEVTQIYLINPKDFSKIGDLAAKFIKVSDAAVLEAATYNPSYSPAMYNALRQKLEAAKEAIAKFLDDAGYYEDEGVEADE